MVCIMKKGKLTEGQRKIVEILLEGEKQRGNWKTYFDIKKMLDK